MEITLAPNVLHTEEQTLTVDKVATLIGENGSGKSTILQSIFESRVSAPEKEFGRLVCFTSGQNESFSDLFSKRLDKIRSRKSNEDIDFGCLYFTKEDVRSLVFLATTFVGNGRTRTFLDQHGYITIENGMDMDSSISLKLSIPSRYIKRVKEDAKAEETDYNHPSIRRRPFNIRLEKFIDGADGLTGFDDILEKSKGIKGRSVKMSSKHVFNLFDGAKEDAAKFFIEGSYNSYFFESSSVRLSSKEGLEFRMLSDGEYQLLFLFALLDLFDSENTLFLFDEADSHLHYKNVAKLWKTINSAKAKVITTTHLLDSISTVGIDNLQVVNRGRIVQEDKYLELVNRLNQLGFVQKAQFKVCSLIENVVLVDNVDDWIIFLALARRKVAGFNPILEQFLAVDKPSSYEQHTCAFGKSKTAWTDAFAMHSTEWDTKTKNVFLICDRDNLPLSSINKGDGVTVNGEKVQPGNWGGKNDPQVHLLSWRHLEIENYLLSFTGLSEHEKGDIDAVNAKLSPENQLKKNSSPDNKHVRSLDAKEFIHPIIKPVKGLCMEKLQAYINLIPPDEISEDIENMYNYIVSKI